ncbi:hypothetical protein [Absidia glauca]|uniref:BZIP domain-containing protein n=1 Tax=Absidia glauca TaxID=4829 RepID=A0A168T1N3_ABSGL|nr:hypothetical protein [Absidia glauca]
MSFTSALDSLALEPLDQVSSYINEEAAAADLALWTNAKFTYDVTPGHSLLDEKEKPAIAPSFDLDKVMYEQLAQYLDIDMTSTDPTHLNAKPSPPSSRHPTLLPKPTELPLFLLPGVTPPQPIPVAERPTRPNNGTEEAGDDDKRRRNTAASARFRMKKKQKEQAMAQTVRDMTDKAEKLQSRVHELENEIKWLRELLLEKNSK